MKIPYAARQLSLGPAATEPESRHRRSCRPCATVKAMRKEDPRLHSRPDSRKPVFQKPRVQSLWRSDKEPACQCRRCGFDLWVGKIPWRRAWQPTPVFLPGESHGQEPGGLRSIGSQRTGHSWSDWACTHITIASRDIPKEERKQSEIIQRAQKPLKVSAFARWVLWEQHPDLRPHCTLISMTSAGYMLISSKQALLPQHRSPDCHLPEIQIPRMQWGWAGAGHLLAGWWHGPRLRLKHFILSWAALPHPTNIFALPSPFFLWPSGSLLSLPLLLVLDTLLKTFCNLGNGFSGQVKVWRLVSVDNQREN